jgi:hypothetical protein
MRRESTPPDDKYMIYCFRLGHVIHFSYCRSENFGLPCFNIMGCWYDHFLVEVFLRENLSDGEWEEWEKMHREHLKPKIVTIVELIKQATKEEGGESAFDSWQ